MDNEISNKFEKDLKELKKVYGHIFLLINQHVFVL
jgi:hypothetical protein